MYRIYLDLLLLILYINGKSLPAIDNLVILAHVMGVKIDDLIVIMK